MNATEARSIGRKKTMITTIIILFIILIRDMIQETRGDFANGILFFLANALHIYAVALYAILFGLTFVLGGRAGKEIILKKKNFIGTAVKYSVVIMLSLFIYIAILGKVGKQVNKDGLPEPMLEYFLTILSGMGIYFILLLAIWLWATYRVRLAGSQKSG